jgi:hypothetical protein
METLAPEAIRTCDVPPARFELRGAAIGWDHYTSPRSIPCGDCPAAARALINDEPQQIRIPAPKHGASNAWSSCACEG